MNLVCVQIVTVDTFGIHCKQFPYLQWKQREPLKYAVVIQITMNVYTLSIILSGKWSQK